MKNLKNNLWLSIKFFGIIALSGGITQNILTYNLIKDEISKAEKNGKEYAKKYCKMTLKESYEDSRLSRIVNGGDDAAREYLEKSELGE